MRTVVPVTGRGGVAGVIETFSICCVILSAVDPTSGAGAGAGAGAVAAADDSIGTIAIVYPIWLTMTRCGELR